MNYSELPAPVRECLDRKIHLTWCDDDGYCNYCGHQETRDELLEDDDPDDIDRSHEMPPMPHGWYFGGVG